MGKKNNGLEPTEYEYMIGARLQRYRKTVMKLSQEEFAEKLELSPSTVSRYERGLSPIPDKVKSLLHAEYGLDLNYLLCGEERTVELDIARAVRCMDDKHIVAYIKALSDELDRRQ